MAVDQRPLDQDPDFPEVDLGILARAVQPRYEPGTRARRGGRLRRDLRAAWSDIVANGSDLTFAPNSSINRSVIRLIVCRCLGGATRSSRNQESIMA